MMKMFISVSRVFLCFRWVVVMVINGVLKVMVKV